MVKGKVFRHRYGLTSKYGFLSNTVHNWDGKTFDKNGYPVADCGARLYPRSILVPTERTSKVCKECFE